MMDDVLFVVAALRVLFVVLATAAGAVAGIVIGYPSRFAAFFFAVYFGWATCLTARAAVDALVRLIFKEVEPQVK